MAGTAAGAAKRVATRQAPDEQDPTKIMETWEITTEGRVWLQVTTFTRHGQPQDKDVSLGPKKPGQKLKISQADRERNQENVADPQFDPFRNGLLVRVDADQQSNPMTASTDAVTTVDLMAIYELKGSEFMAAVEALGQVPIRRLQEMSEAVDATTSQVAMIEQVIEERWRQTTSQPDAVFDLSGIRRPEREGK